MFAAVTDACVRDREGDLPDDRRAELTLLLERLKGSDWAGRVADDDWPDAEDRTALVDQALESLRPPTP
ncbi:hypothetical protein [Streptomyces sp. enrichment culture]|uniref:hypothetical protein n=1 Tax=Streptomyces sp. enrichment culture TaxID=1795815 RepID=UPI003F54AD98